MSAPANYVAAGVDNLRTANFHRAAAAGIRDAELARDALDTLGDKVPLRWQLVAEQREKNPVASWAEIAGQLGITKDAAIGCFRRLIKHAEATS
jgi:DNA-binding transcriptional regulator WhiA